MLVLLVIISLIGLFGDDDDRHKLGIGSRTESGCFGCLGIIMLIIIGFCVLISLAR